LRGIRNAYNILVGKPVGKKRLKWKEDDEIKIYFKWIVSERAGWINLVQLRALVNKITNIRAS
jgi:hypothetical protein